MGNESSKSRKAFSQRKKFDKTKSLKPMNFKQITSNYMQKKAKSTDMLEIELSRQTSYKTVKEINENVDEVV